MAKQIPNTLKRLALRLFPTSEVERDAFIQGIANPHEFPVAVVWLQERPGDMPFPTLATPDWCPEFVDLVEISHRPGRNVLHEEGAYYCMDLSSVFMAEAFAHIGKSSTVMDVCASPGGKSILAFRHLAPGLLISNEVIGKRLGALHSNLRRCQIHPVQVSSTDTSKLAETGRRSANVVIVDAPCSGQSLLARGKESPGCFHPATINMNANRQRRILANASGIVSHDGFLAYMTCTYSLKENERNLEWFLKKNPLFESVDIPSLQVYRSDYSQHHCYRMWPHHGQGAGGFTCLLRRLE